MAGDFGFENVFQGREKLSQIKEAHFPYKPSENFSVLNSRFRYFSLEREKLQNSLDPKVNALTSSFPVFKMLDILVTKRHDQYFLALSLK